jgi:hypothetical protein
MSGNTKWMYLKYDNANRVAVEGIYTHGSTVTAAQMQTVVNGQACYATNSTTNYEQRLSSTMGYSNQCFPTVNIENRQYHYYDDYDFNYDGTADYSKLPQGLTNEATATGYTYGLPTGNKKLILGTTTWLTEMNFYDKYYHTIQVRSNNQLVSTVSDEQTNVVSFTGKVLESKKETALTTWTATVKNRYIYDNMERLTEVKQTNVTNGTYSELTVARYVYNALGQIINKKLNSTNGTTFLQSVDMRYNIRGQLTSINNSARTTNSYNNDAADNEDLFGMEIFYDKTADVFGNSNGISNAIDYRGMISGVKWSAKTTSTPDEKSYIYTYDKPGRLSTSYYKAKAWGAGSFIKDLGGFDENLTYDENGNILTLLRKAMLGSTLTTIDNLTYTYKGIANNNQLDYISDAVPNVATGYGFQNFTGAATTAAYAYDDNGNLTADPKKGTTITYNELNKPTLIQV